MSTTQATSQAMKRDDPGFRPEDVAGYIYKRAHWYALNKPSDMEDLRQEGLIAAWRSVGTFKADKGIPFKSWVMRSIDYAMFENRYRGTWTGMPPRSRNGGSSTKESDIPVGLGRNGGTDDGPQFKDGSWILDRADSGLPEGSDWKYHEIEILKAIGQLRPDQQKYLYLRFWLGLKPREIATHFPNVNNPATSLWYDSSSGARAHLRKVLAHLSIR